MIELTPPSPPAPLSTLIVEDVRAVMDNDPAAGSLADVALNYPGLHAIWLHRLAHHVWLGGNHLLARTIAHVNRAMTGIEIHPAAQLGRRVFIDHGMGVVIGETAVVGDGCLFYKGVVLGGTTLDKTKRHPTLGQGVIVGSNACILGNVRIGDNAQIGSGSVVIKDVPAGATAVGVPGRIVATTATHRPLDHAALPDPVATVIRTLTDHIEHLQSRIAALEDGRDPPTNGRAASFDDQVAGERADELAAMFFEDFGD